MFLPPVLTPLVSGQITGLSTAYNDTTNHLKTAILGLRADLALQNMASAGGGRFVDSDAAMTPTGAGSPRVGAGLAVHLPDASWLVDGKIVILADLQGYVPPVGDNPGYYILPDAPPEQISYGHLVLNFDDDDDDPVYTLGVEWHAASGWTIEDRQAARAAGKPCIGLVDAGVDTIDPVEGLDLTAADVIWSTRLLQEKVKTALTVTPTDPGGGGGGDTGTTLRLDDLKYSVDHPTDTATTYIENLIAQLGTELTELIETGGRVPIPSENGLMTHRLALTLLMLRGLDTLGVEGLEGAYVRKGMGGEGSANTEDHVLRSTMMETDRGWTP